MKNKGLTYGLIVVVGVIYYQVFVRIKSNFSEEEAAAAGVQARPGMKQFIHTRENFSLAANYRDPFSGNMSATEMSAPPSPAAMQMFPPEPKPPKPAPPQFIWPSVKYYGLVRETRSSKPLTVISIDGEIFKLRQGDRALDDVLIKKTYRDSIVIQYQKKTKTFYKARK